MSASLAARPALGVAQAALHLAAHLARFDGLTLVEAVPAARQRELDLGPRPREVEAGGHERQAALARLADQPLDLAAVEQELAVALGLVVLAAGRRVGRDVHVV